MKQYQRKRSPKRKGSKKGSKKSSSKQSRKRGSKKRSVKRSEKKRSIKRSKKCVKDGVLVSILKGNCPPDWEEVKKGDKVYHLVRPFSGGGKNRLVCRSSDGDKVEVYKKRCPNGYRKSSAKKQKFHRGKKMVDVRFISPRKI